MKKPIVVLCLIFVTLFSVSAFADDKLNVPKSLKEGFYFSGTAGLSLAGDADFEDSETDDSLEVDYNEGYLFGGAIGYDFGAFRVEIEGAYRENDFDELNDITIDGENYGDLSADGEMSALSCMLNGYFDFETNTPLTPYIGGGIGLARLDMDDFGVDDQQETISEDDTVFAYQAAVGFGYDISRNTTIDVGYRYFATEDPDFDGADAEYDDHNVSFTLRYTIW